MNRRSREPGPLASLPRPLADRDRGRGRWRRRLLALLTVALIVGAVAIGSSVVGRGAGPAVGEVAGATGTPEPTASGEPVVIGYGVDPEFPVVITEASPSPAVIAQPTEAPMDGDPDTAAGDPAAAPGPTPDVTAPADVGGTAADPDAAEAHGPDPADLTGYRWPLPHGRLTLPFGPTPWGGWIVDGKKTHDGIDIATFCNDRIVAAHDGVVIAAGRHFDDQIGWVGSLKRYYARLDKKHLWKTLPIMVVIDDGNGYRSMYAHFWKIVVKKGDKVKAGKLLGYEGMTGRASGCHLHYGLFSPVETATFATDKDVAKRMKLPKAEMARIDPLLVLPARAKDPKPITPAWSEPSPAP